MFPICKNILLILPKNRFVDGNLVFHTFFLMQLDRKNQKCLKISIIVSYLLIFMTALFCIKIKIIQNLCQATPSMVSSPSFSSIH